MKPTLRRIARSMTKGDSRVKRLRQSIDQSNDIVQRLHTALLETGCDHCLLDNRNFYAGLSEELCEASQRIKQEFEML